MSASISVHGPWQIAAIGLFARANSRMKDLRLAVWLAEAHAKTRHLRGLGDGYALLAGLCEHYWDGLHPLPEGGDYEQRIGNLFWLLSRTPQLLCEMPLTEAGGWSWADFEAARQRAVHADAAAGQQWGKPADDGAPLLADLDAERRRNSARYNDALLADAEYCLAMQAELERVVDARLGADGPGFGAARDALGKLIAFIAPLASAAPAAHPAEIAQGTAASGLSVASTPTSNLQNRQQALAQLRLVAEFFRRTEPHSPVAYLADKAASWGEMPLHRWLRAVVKDPAALAQFDELLGSSAGAD